jgi:hypothetical protein
MNMALNPRKDRNDPTVRAVLDRQREERTKGAEEATRRMEETQPTPTQEENDLAKLGVIVEEKEDDRSGETVITRTIVANQPLGYETRAARTREGTASSQPLLPPRARSEPKKETP